MSIQKNRMSCMRIAYIVLLVLFTLLWAGTQVYAGPVGVGFASSGEYAVELTNSYEDILTLRIFAPKAGYVVLTGSGVLTLTGPSSSLDPIWGWALITIGISGEPHNLDQSYANIPFARGGGYETTIPFSITTVIPVGEGVNSFSMTGIRDPNTEWVVWNVWPFKLTAIFVDNRIDE